MKDYGLKLSQPNIWATQRCVAFMCHFFQPLHQNLHAQSKTNTVISIQKNTQPEMHVSQHQHCKFCQNVHPKNRKCLSIKTCTYIQNAKRQRRDSSPHKPRTLTTTDYLIRYLEVIFIGPEVNFYARILLFHFHVIFIVILILPPFYTFSFMVIVHTTKYKIHLK